MVVVPERVTVGKAQSSVNKVVVAVLAIGHPGTVISYWTTTVVLPVPLNVIPVPASVADPERIVNSPPEGEGNRSVDVPLQ